MLERTQHTLTYRTVKNFGGKIVWQIRTVGSLVEKLWRIEVHLHRECYGNCSTTNVFYCKVYTCTLCKLHISIYISTHAYIRTHTCKNTLTTSNVHI